jgi:hypothetical protein
MSLPRGDEYNQAVQNPAISFADIELKNSTVETTPLGLPKPYSGGFTTTYKLKNSKKNWAVRCFTREIKDLQKRYQSIGNFTNSNNCSFLVDAKYVQNGIRIRGNYHPIIKMDWLEGEPLNIYIDKIYNQKAKLESLLNEFVNLIKQLEGFGIAHGDLQHGNIMVKGGKLFLIDYDGMYLPDLSSLNVNELGHPNFQHPRRTSIDYNKSIDRFSSLIIYTAIKAVSINPNLWKKYENGDNLLFKGSDFINPQSSPLLKELVGYPELKRLTNNIAIVCTFESSKIPTLNTFLDTTIASSTRVLPQVTTVRSAYPVLDGKQKGQLLEHVGERVEVVGKVQGSYQGTTQYGNPYVFLNFGRFPNQTFKIIIWSEGISALKDRGVSISSLSSEWVSITGVISTYLGKPQMTLESPSQIQALGSQSNATAKLNYRSASTSTKQTPPLKKPIVKEDFWDNYLKNKPVTPEPKPQVVIRPQPIIPKPKPQVIIRPQPKPKPTPNLNTYTYTPLKSTPKSTTTSSSKSTSNSDSGFMMPIIIGIIGAFIIGGISESGGGAIIGFVIGGWIGLAISD